MESSSRKRVLEDIAPNCLLGKAPDTFIPKSKVQKIYSTTEERETDITRLQARLKQIAFGKNTSGYDKYIQEVPKNKRRGYTLHPRTPDPTEKISKRSFDGKIKAWRRMLHSFDPSNLELGDDLESKFASNLLVNGSDVQENDQDGCEMDVSQSNVACNSVTNVKSCREDEHPENGHCSDSDDDIL